MPAAHRPFNCSGTASGPFPGIDSSSRTAASGTAIHAIKNPAASFILKCILTSEKARGRTCSPPPTSFIFLRVDHDLYAAVVLAACGSVVGVHGFLFTL